MSNSSTAPAQPPAYSQNSHRTPVEPKGMGADKIVNLKKLRRKEKERPQKEREENYTVVREQMLERLLAYESEVRNASSLRELVFCLTNETLQITQGRQVFLIKPRKLNTKQFKLDAVSNLSSIESNSPTVIHLEKQFTGAVSTALKRPQDMLRSPFNFDFSPGRSQSVSVTVSAVLLPLFDKRGEVVAALAIVGEEADFAKEAPVLKRVINVASHAWSAFLPRKKPIAGGLMKRITLWVALLASILVLFVRVPLSTLAPVEIVPQNPQIVAAPINGVVDRILIDANSTVTKGTELFRYVDTVLVSELKIAEQRLAVASAKLQTARQNSFGAGAGRRDIATAEAEQKLAESELNFARNQFSQTVVKSPADGVAIFDRKTDWQGRPVSVGERVIEIADTAKVEARIDLAVSDVIVIEEGARVQFYLDSNPLHPINGWISSAAYRATSDEANALSFKIFANIDPDETVILRIGARGTAQIFGEDVSVAFYLFRRPLSAVRQWVGW